MSFQIWGPCTRREKEYLWVWRCKLSFCLVRYWWQSELRTKRDERGEGKRTWFEILLKNKLITGMLTFQFWNLILWSPLLFVPWSGFMDFLQILHENIRIRHVKFARQQISGHANDAWASAYLIQFPVYLRVLQKRKCVVVDGKTWEMLSDREKEGCKTILNKLPQKDLLTLTDTVTNRVVTPENTQGI